MKKPSYLIFLAVSLAVSQLSCHMSQELYFAAPTVLPNTHREMKTAGFWVSRHPSPDKIVLNSEEIAQLNLEIQNRTLTKDITHVPSHDSAKDLLSLIESKLNEFAKKGYYLADGSRATANFFNEIRANMNLNEIPGEKMMPFGFVAHFADQRFLLTEKGLYEKQGDIDFDELQNSDLDAATPVAILHTSLDGKWYFVESEISSGWVRADKIALCGLGELKGFISQRNFAVVTSAKADIFLNSNLNEHYDYVRMGVKFPIVTSNANIVEIQLPVRNTDGTLSFKSGYIKREDVREGFLPYTPRNILDQAFKLLNEPYGWGGMHGEQDCSRFLHEVFSTVGIVLPRDSKDQARIGRVTAQFDEKTTPAQKLEILKTQAPGGITILPMKGHIMLYLGMVDERAYVIHAVWGYRQKSLLSEDAVRVINRVAVSDLSLGEGSHKGSLLERLNAVIVVDK